METRKNILAIDDNSDNLITIKALILEAFPDFNVMTSLSGKLGLELAVTEKPDVILLDIVMPEMDGYEVCEKLKANDKTTDIPVIFVTAIKGDKESRIKALEVGGEAFLAKPIDEYELTAQLRAMLKIKASTDKIQNEKEELEKLVKEKTRELNENHVATLNLLEDIRKENDARKLTEESLIASEAKYRELMENSPEGITIYVDGKVAYINNEAMRLMRATDKSELIGKTIMDFVHPDNVDLILERMKLVAMAPINSILPSVEEKYIRLDGTEVVVEIKAMPIMYDGNFGIQLTGHDITDRILSQKALEDSRLELKAIYDNAPVMMCVIDEDTKIQFSNKAFDEITHNIPREIQGNQLGNIIGCINSVRTKKGCGSSAFCSTCTLRNIIQDTLTTGVVHQNIEHSSYIISNGEKVELSLLASTAVLNSGNKKSILLLLHDITNRKKAEKALKNSENQLKNLFEFSPISIWEEDFSEVKKYFDHLKSQKIKNLTKYFNEELSELKEVISKIKVVGINETNLKLFDVETKEEILNNLTSYFQIDDENKKVFIDEFVTLAKGKTHFEGETHIFRKDGKKLNLLLNLTVMPGYEHTLSKVLVSFIDITDRKVAEEALQKSETFLRTFIENSPFEIWARDYRNIGILENKKMVDHFGSIIGKTPESFENKEPDVIKLWENNNRRAFAGEMINENAEYYINNRLYTYQQIIFPIFNLEEIIGIAGFNIDISERIEAEIELKRSENALNRQNELLSLLLKNLPVGVFMIEAPSGKALLANDTALHLLGRGILPETTKDNITEVYNIHKIDSNEPYPADEMPLLLGLKGISSHVDDMMIVRPDGTETLLEVYGTPVTDENGTIWASLVNFSDITERKKAEIALINYQEQLQQFAAHLQNVREEEKVNLAREIHDDLGQILVALKIDMGMLKQKVFKDFQQTENNDIFLKFDNLVGLLDKTIKTTRRIMSGLRPEQLELLGLVDSIKQYTHDFEDRYGIICSFESNIDYIELNPQQSVALFRILQEALSNVTRHAKASNVTVSIEVNKNNLIMKISDNGVGFDKTKSGRTDSYGLIGMKERVYLLGGKLNIAGEPGKGTTVLVEVQNL